MRNFTCTLGLALILISSPLSWAATLAKPLPSNDPPKIASQRIARSTWPKRLAITACGTVLLAASLEVFSDLKHLAESPSLREATPARIAASSAAGGLLGTADFVWLVSVLYIGTRARHLNSFAELLRNHFSVLDDRLREGFQAPGSSSVVEIGLLQAFRNIRHNDDPAYLAEWGKYLRENSEWYLQAIDWLDEMRFIASTPPRLGGTTLVSAVGYPIDYLPRELDSMKNFLVESRLGDDYSSSPKQ
jgi:hypothetical protein